MNMARKVLCRCPFTLGCSLSWTSKSVCSSSSSNSYMSLNRVRGGRWHCGAFWNVSCSTRGVIKR